MAEDIDTEDQGTPPELPQEEGQVAKEGLAEDDEENEDKDDEEK
ncbi:MAG: hypothetical protein V4480_04450 [Patescibacteria group bacterium]